MELTQVFSRVLVVISLMATACVKGRTDPIPPQPLLPPGEHLLFEPTGAARTLLGRKVLFDRQGAFRIADYLAPGCRVEVVASPDAWNREFADEASRLVAGGADLGKLGQLGGKHAQQVVSAMVIENQEVLTARLKGPCGDRVITKVKVGTGSRRVYRAHHQRGGVRLSIPETEIGASLEGQGFERLRLDLTWSRPQAWGIEVSDPRDADDGVRMEVVLDPTTVKEGESFRVRVRADETVSLLVIAQEDIERDGRAAVILPALTHTGGHVIESVAAAGDWTELPPADASLRTPQIAQHDRLIVYGLRHTADLEGLELQRGNLSDPARAEEAQRVMHRLDALPPQRVSRREVGYRIVPNAP